MSGAETVSWMCRPDGQRFRQQQFGDDIKEARLSGMPISITIDADDIRHIADDRLREALVAQRNARQQKIGGLAVVAFWPSNVLSHTVRVPTRSLIEYAQMAAQPLDRARSMLATHEEDY